MRGQDDAAGVAGPVLHVERRVVFGQEGSPALPKIDSTKSRLLTRLPGAKKRVSIVLRGQTPGTSGPTSGRKSSEMKHRAGSGRSAENGTTSRSAGGCRACWKRAAAVTSGTDFLSPGIGRPPSAIWKVPGWSGGRRGGCGARRCATGTTGHTHSRSCLHLREAIVPGRPRAWARPARLAGSRSGESSFASAK